MKYILFFVILVLAIAVDDLRSDLRRLKNDVSGLESKVFLLEGKLK